MREEYDKCVRYVSVIQTQQGTKNKEVANIGTISIIYHIVETYSTHM